MVHRFAHPHLLSRMLMKGRDDQAELRLLVPVKTRDRQVFALVVSGDLGSAGLFQTMGVSRGGSQQ